MFDLRTPVIIKGYSGFIVSWEASNIWSDVCLYNITLRDPRDSRITIVMEDIRHDEITQNPMS